MIAPGAGLGGMEAQLISVGVLAAWLAAQKVVVSAKPHRCWVCGPLAAQPPVASGVSFSKGCLLKAPARLFGHGCAAGLGAGWRDFEGVWVMVFLSGATWGIETASCLAAMQRPSPLAAGAVPAAQGGPGRGLVERNESGERGRTNPRRFADHGPALVYRLVLRVRAFRLGVRAATV